MARETLNWTPKELDTLTTEARAKFDAIAEARKALRETEEQKALDNAIAAFEAQFEADEERRVGRGLPADKVLRFAYRFGKFSVAVADKPKARAAAPAELW